MDEHVGPTSPDQTAPPPASYSRDQKPTWNLLGKFFALFSNRTTAIAGVLVLVLGVGAATLAVQRSTETRQQAATSCSLIINPTTVSPNGSFLLRLKGDPRTSYTIGISGGNELINYVWITDGSGTYEDRIYLNNLRPSMITAGEIRVVSSDLSGGTCSGTVTISSQPAATGNFQCISSGSKYELCDDRSCYPAKNTIPQECINGPDNYLKAPSCSDEPNLNSCFCGETNHRYKLVCARVLLYKTCSWRWIITSAFVCKDKDPAQPPDGGGGGGGSGATGSISANPTNCTIPAGQNTCSTTITWTASSNSPRPIVCIDHVWFTDNHFDSDAVAPWITARAGGHTFTLFDNGCDSNALASVTVTGQAQNNPPVTIGGKVTSTVGTGIPNVSIQVYDDTNNKQTQTAITDSSGNWSISNFVRKEDGYAVRIPNIAPSGYIGGPKTTTSGWNVNHCAKADTPLSSPSYECQSAGYNDCAGPDGNGTSLRCNFAYSPASSTPIPTIAPNTYTISGAIFVDTNNDGVKNGAEVNYTATTPTIKIGATNSTTNTGGAYTFSGLAGNLSYNIQLTVPAGYVLSYSGANPNSNSRDVAVFTGNVSGVNFGIKSTASASTPTPTPGVNTLNINSSPTGIKITSINVLSGGYPGGITNYTKTSSGTIDARLDAPGTFVKNGTTYNFSSASGCQIGRDADDTDNYCWVRVTGNTTQNVTFTYTR